MRELKLFGGVAGGIVVAWLAALTARRWVSRRGADRQPWDSVSLADIERVLRVEAELWRGPAPGPGGHLELAGAGVTHVVDLRSEPDAQVAAAEAQRHGLTVVSLPIDNGRAPELGHLDQLEAAMSAAPGRVYVHCEAGEGRTGAIVGAHLVRRGTPVRSCILDALAVGPLSFAQIAFVAWCGRFPRLLRAIDWVIDRPTEWIVETVAGRPSRSAPARRR